MKLSFPGGHAIHEAAALRSFAGRGAVELFAHEPSVAALLLTRAEPGQPLAELCATDDQRATSVAASITRALQTEIHLLTGFPSVQTWQFDLERLSKLAHGHLSALVVDARAVMADLAASSSRHVLLHGDLHQFNILRAGDAWLAIDPKGIAGERECELAPFVLNPLRPDLAEILPRRIAQLCEELALDRHRAWAWTFVRAALAILWSLEDHGDAPAEWIACLRILRSTQ